MMNVDSIVKGMVIDHIPAGMGMTIYKQLNLDALDYSVALIKNVKSRKLGKKDIIKIENQLNVDLDALGYIAPDITVNIIEGGKVTKKLPISLPELLTNVIKCKNPRCITSVEQGIAQQFRLTDTEKKVYRCVYCEQEY
ncbi:MAG: aspartate carbamoyltransferase regulatory subunit [Defluviitaleaceae bacterium]|nr:aspartate carbamoyltransferase regulatory subunit [Defluviitaleaceae bacterium]